MEGTLLGAGAGAGIGAILGYSIGGKEGATIGELLGAAMGFIVSNQTTQRKQMYVTLDELIEGETQATANFVQATH